MRWKLPFLLVLLFSNYAASAREFMTGLVRVAKERELYVEYRSALNRKPTLFLVNGLTYSTKEWQKFVTALDQIDPDFGLVLFDMNGMGRTLLNQGPVDQAIPFLQQTQDIKRLYKTLAIPGKKILVGLSYGGGVTLNYMAEYPQDFDRAVAMAPFLGFPPESDSAIKSWARFHGMFVPWDARGRDELYDYYLHEIVFKTFPKTMPNLLENPHKLEAVFRLVQGSKNWSAKDIAPRLPKGKINLIAAKEDEIVKLGSLDDFWEQVPVPARASYLRLKRTEHRIPEDQPEFAAQWIARIAKGDADLQEGAVFTGDPRTMRAQSGEHVLDVSSCEDRLTVAPEPTK